MIKFFRCHKRDVWSGSVNWADENNVVLGYDEDQSCCEYASWVLVGADGERLEDGDESIPWPDDFVFDPTYFESLSDAELEQYDIDVDEGDAVRFRVTNGKEEGFIILFNCHNGYYGHGFDFMHGDQSIQEGAL